MPKPPTLSLAVLAVLILSIGILWLTRRPGKEAESPGTSSGSTVGSIEGRVVDRATGQRCQAMMTVSTHDFAHVTNAHATTGMSRDTGVFVYDGLRPGDYDVTARTKDGRTGTLEGVSVEAGSEITGLTVKVEPGSCVGVRFEGGVGEGFLTFIHGDVIVASELIHPPASLLVVVPARAATARFVRLSGDPPQERRVEVAVGDEKDIVFGNGG